MEEVVNTFFHDDLFLLFFFSSLPLFSRPSSIFMIQLPLPLALLLPLLFVVVEEIEGVEELEER